MSKIKNLSGSILEGIAYGVLGGIFTLAVLAIQDFLARIDSPNLGFAIDSHEQSIGLGCLFLGLSVSAIFGNLFFGKLTKSLFIKWLFIVITSSVTTILIQMGILIYFTGKTFNEIISDNNLELVWDILGWRWMIKLFVILTPFTILFASRRSLVEKFQNRNLLK